MTQQIKQRIEQIQRGKVPEGYKKTKVGIIPAEWIVKLLSDVFQKQNAKNTTNAVHNVLTNSATQGIISQMDYFDKRIANDENTASYFLVYNGCFVYNPRISTSAPCGPFNRYDGLEMGIMSPLYTVYIYKDSSNSCSDYLSYFFSSSKWHGYMNGIANYGARSDRMNVTIEDMNNLPLPYPPLPEQEKIAKILSAQDRVIELCEKKVEQLKKLKKVFLQKMFPKPGATAPEWRFPGFTAAWEQRKLGDVFEEYSEKNHAELPPLTIVQGFGTIPREDSGRDIQYDKSSLHNYKLVNQGDFILHLRSFEGGLEMANSQGVVSPAYHIFHGEEADSRFYYPFFRSFYFINILLKPHVYGIRDGKSIDVEGMKSILIPYPKYNEQKRIGDFFEEIDKTITLHQRKCDEEKQKKKALMQLLLTGIVRT